LLASIGQWLERRRLSITDFDEQLAERFIAYKRQKGRVHRGNRETLLQFLDDLRKRDVIPGQTPSCDDSPLAAILTRYERHLRSERGLADATVINYLPCIRKFFDRRFSGEAAGHPRSQIIRCFRLHFAARTNHEPSKGTTGYRRFPLFLPLPFSKRGAAG
jgi:hypothetical protein